MRVALLCTVVSAALFTTSALAQTQGRQASAGTAVGQGLTTGTAVSGRPLAGTPAGSGQGAGSAQLAPSAVGAFDLSSAWQAALKNDPSYQAAISEREAGQTNRAMGRAGLLPKVTASAGRTKMRGTLDSPTAFGDVVTEDLDYTAKTNEIRATQPLFSWSKIAEYRQGNARADYSLAVFDTRAKDTSVRLVNRYFEALLAYENVVLARNNLEANQKHLEAAQRRFDSGEGTVTDVRETRSRLDLSRAELIQRQDALVVARRELQEMVGVSPDRLVGLTPKFPILPLNPPTLADWVAMAMAGNSEIRTGEEGLRIAEAEIDRSFGGHLPSVDLVAARRVVENESISTRNQKSATNSIGVQVSLPVFSGGLTSAQVDQARHNRDRARSELAATRERVAVEVTRQYQGVVSGAERIRALEVAVQSSVDALQAVERGYQAGTRSVVDILDVQERLYRARLDLTRARLEYVLARLMLSAAAGTLDSTVIDNINQSYFDSRHIDVLQASLPIQQAIQGERQQVAARPGR